jgi:hypothetical protein
VQQRHTQNHVDGVDDNEAQAAQIDSVSDLQTTKSGTNLGTKAPISNHSKPEQKNPSRRQGKYLQQQHTKKVNNPKKDAHSEEGGAGAPAAADFQRTSASEDATLGSGPQVGGVSGRRDAWSGRGGTARRGWWRDCAARPRKCDCRRKQTRRCFDSFGGRVWEVQAWRISKP